MTQYKLLESPEHIREWLAWRGDSVNKTLTQYDCLRKASVNSMTCLTINQLRDWTIDSYSKNYHTTQNPAKNISASLMSRLLFSSSHL